jgi:hypothetical protein
LLHIRHATECSPCKLASLLPGFDATIAYLGLTLVDQGYPEPLTTDISGDNIEGINETELQTKHDNLAKWISGKEPKVYYLLIYCTKYHINVFN